MEMKSPYRIIPKRGYYEVRDANGNFVLSADTAREAEDELTSMLVQYYEQSA